MKKILLVSLIIFLIGQIILADELDSLVNQLKLRVRRLITFTALSYVVETPKSIQSPSIPSQSDFPGIQVINVSKNQDAVIAEPGQIVIRPADNSKTALLVSPKNNCAVIAGTNETFSFLTSASDTSFVQILFNVLFDYGKMAIAIVTNTDRPSCAKSITNEAKKYAASLNVIIGPTDKNLYIALDKDSKELTLTNKTAVKKVVVVVKVSGK